MKCQYCNKDFYIGNFNDTVCDSCAKERSRTVNTSQPITLSRAYFGERPPTIDDVIEALNVFTGQDVLYSEETHEFYYTENTSGPINQEQFITETYEKGLWTLSTYLPPRLITLIGRFYESLEEKR